MMKLERSYWIGSFVSAVLVSLVVCRYNFFAGWLAYIPIFLATINDKPKISFLKGLLWGMMLSVLALYWLIPGVERFTGHGIGFALVVFALALIFLALYHACLLMVYAFIKVTTSLKHAIWLNSLLMASVFCIGETLLMIVASGCPWFDEHAGSGLTTNLYSIQHASLFGIQALSFAVIFFNCLAAHYIQRRQYVQLYKPVVFFLLYMLTGYILFESFQPKNERAPFSIAIIAENIEAEAKWDSTAGDMLVQRLIDLNRSAVSAKPNIVLWSESGIPWMYSDSDRLVKEVLQITAPAHATHILGINTQAEDNATEFHNSAYCVLPDGKVTGRYDKQFMLSFVERPIGGMAMPFLSNNGYKERTNRLYNAPLKTPYGNAGILICNEAAVSAAGTHLASAGADFLLNMSNDGWFDDTYIVEDHFYAARLRAVETRKDIAINSNNGYSGMIKASGEIGARRRDDHPFVEVVSVRPNDTKTLATACPNLLAYICVLYVLVMLAIGARSSAHR